MGLELSVSEVTAESEGEGEGAPAFKRRRQRIEQQLLSLAELPQDVLQDEMLKMSPRDVHALCTTAMLSTHPAYRTIVHIQGICRNPAFKQQRLSSFPPVGEVKVKTTGPLLDRWPPMFRTDRSDVFYVASRENVLMEVQSYAPLVGTEPKRRLAAHPIARIDVTRETPLGFRSNSDRLLLFRATEETPFPAPQNISIDEFHIDTGIRIPVVANIPVSRARAIEVVHIMSNRAGFVLLDKGSWIICSDGKTVTRQKHGILNSAMHGAQVGSSTFVEDEHGGYFYASATSLHRGRVDFRTLPFYQYEGSIAQIPSMRFLHVAELENGAKIIQGIYHSGIYRSGADYQLRVWQVPSDQPIVRLHQDLRPATETVLLRYLDIYPIQAFDHSADGRFAVTVVVQNVGSANSPTIATIRTDGGDGTVTAEMINYPRGFRRLVEGHERAFLGHIRVVLSPDLNRYVLWFMPFGKPIMFAGRLRG